jgi:hypothetical protein
MVTWSPNYDALPKHVDHLFQMPNVELQIQVKYPSHVDALMLEL